MPTTAGEPFAVTDVLVYAMVTTSAADRVVSDAELKRIGELVRRLPVFTGFDQDSLPRLAATASEILSGDDGLHSMLDVIAHALPERLHDTCYALAVEIAAADLRLEQEELRFLRLLADRLDLDRLVTAAIERAAKARYRRG